VARARPGSPADRADLPPVPEARTVPDRAGTVPDPVGTVPDPVGMAPFPIGRTAGVGGQPRRFLRWTGAALAGFRQFAGAASAAVAGLLRRLTADGWRVSLWLRRATAGPWRVAVAEGSMLPTIQPGDWLLVDPTVRRWPRPGSLVVIREPGSELLALKRVAGRGGTVISGVRVEDEAGGEREVTIRLLPGQAWLLSDADPALSAAAGFGTPIDSRRYGPVQVDRLVARAWFRYWPPRRIGLLRAPAGPPRGIPRVDRQGGS
jgi:hypothetical protein